jgi:hypothetical protein
LGNQTSKALIELQPAVLFGEIADHTKMREALVNSANTIDEAAATQAEALRDMA